ncbi:MAG TPA: hypothetical protein VGU43_05540 [Thermoplasmata archaeon]|nr:hypothetical protein [Thermoplasmata archaeon]
MAWLAYYTLAFASAPVFDYLSRRASVELPTGAVRCPAGRRGPVVAA